MKGFDIYKKLDMMLGNRFWKDKVQFTYIGNIPKNFHFQNTRHVKPLNEIGLARELKNHHGYLTASINEPGVIIKMKVLYVACHCYTEIVVVYQNIVKDME